MSDVPKQVLRKIQQAKEQQLKELDLSYSQLTTLPEALFQLKNLTQLKLGLNKLATLPEALFQLQNLTSLDLSDNQLTKIPEVLTQLKSLISLNLSNNQLTVIPDGLTQLKNLALLNLGGNYLAVIPDGLTQLKNLASLNLSRNRLATIPDGLTQLKNLTSLYLINTPVVSSLRSSTGFPALEWIVLSGCDMREVPDFIQKSSKLYGLVLADNELTYIPEWISDLRQLKILRLRNNAFLEIPEIIYSLPFLEEVNFSSGPLLGGSEHKNRITKISPKILRLKNLKELSLEGNPIETPPPEVVNKGVDAIKEYFRQLEREGTDYLYEAKLLIVGEPGAGKTSLAKKIQDPNYVLREDEASTEGIAVAQWQFPIENGRQFRVNIWDFGGQEVYHATHQFFLTKRSLYALVADTRKEDTDFYYWLNVVELLSDSSPVLLVKNEKQDRHREISERQLRGQFANLEKTLPANLATNRGLPELLTAIKHAISTLPHIGTPLPRTWVKVREALENDPRNHISRDEYLAICEQHGFSQLKDKLQLSGYLHDLGVCLHFQDDPLLKKTVILKPKWGTDAVYKVLDNKRVIGHLGRFNRADLAQIWHAPEYADMQDELLQLMINFKLCYQIPGTRDTFIAPQLLTENQPDYDWDETDNLVMRYTYDFMPKGIITQFIVAMNALIAQQALVWKSGVILEKDQTRAEVVEYYGRREIKIRVAGKHQKELMTIVAYELDAIHDSYRRLKYQKLTPCNCEKCRQSQEPHFYRLDVLRQFVEDRENHIQCQKSYRMVDVLGLIDDVIARSQLAEAGGQPSREQLSAPSLRQMLIEHFSDSELNDLCFDLGIDYESIKGQAKSDKARELVAHVRRHSRAAELIDQCRRLRPDAHW